MTLTDTILALESANEEFDTFFIRCEALLEASWNEYNINLKEAELKVIEEGGNKSDKDYLQGKASEGLIGKTRKIIMGIIEAFKKWLKEACDKVASLFNDAKTKLALKKAEKVCKENKELKNKKVTIIDRKSSDKEYDKLSDRVSHKIALLKSGRFTEKDEKEVDKITEDLNGISKKQVGKAVVVTVGALAAILLGAKVATDQYRKACINAPKEDIIDEPKKARAYTKLINLESRIKKEKVSNGLKSFTDALSKLKSAITGKEPKKGEIDPTVESAEDSIVKELETEVKNDMAKETVENTDKYLESLIEELELEEVLEESVEDYDFENIYEESASILDEEDDELEIESAIDDLLSSIEDEDVVEESEDSEENTEDETVEESEDSLEDIYNYIAALESEVFADDEDYEIIEESEVSIEEDDYDAIEEAEDASLEDLEDYITALESELFEEDDEEVVEESEDDFEDLDAEYERLMEAFDAIDIEEDDEFEEAFGISKKPEKSKVNNHEVVRNYFGTPSKSELQDRARKAKILRDVAKKRRTGETDKEELRDWVSKRIKNTIIKPQDEAKLSRDELRKRVMKERFDSHDDFDNEMAELERLMESFDSLNELYINDILEDLE